MSAKMQRFTQRARRVLSLAEQEARQLQHGYIGTEHLLLGLLRETGSVAGRALSRLGLNVTEVAALVEHKARSGERRLSSRLDLSSNAKKVLELSVDEARRMGHHYIGTEHLLLALVRYNDGVAIDVLKALNVSPAQIRQQTHRVLQESPATRPSSPPRRQGGQAGRFTAWRVLLVDDEPDNLAVPEQILRHFGAAVRTANDSVQALEILDSFQPTLILVDLSLPGRDAWQLLNQVRARPGMAGIPVIALAGPAARSEIAGFDGAIFKPFLLDTFLEDLEQAVNRQVRKPSVNLGRFTPDARDVLSRAQNATMRLSSAVIATEFLLLGLLENESGVAGRILRDGGLDAKEVGAAIERRNPGSGVESRDRLELSPGTQAVITLAVSIARELGSHSVDTEHLLLSLVSHHEEGAVEILHSFNFTPEQVWERAREAVQTSMPARPRRIALYIHENPVILDRVALALENRRITVFGATSASEALKLLEEHTPDIVLLHPATAAGWETYRHMKVVESLRAIPVITIATRAPDFEDLIRSITSALARLK